MRRGCRSESKDENWVISKIKKKKKVIACQFHALCDLRAQMWINFVTVDVLTFFFGDHPNFCLLLQIRTLGSAIKLATALHRPAFVGEVIEMSINLVKSVLLH